MKCDYGAEEKCVEFVEGKPERNRQLGRPKRKCQHNI
jgi:hypothetical protein